MNSSSIVLKNKIKVMVIDHKQDFLASISHFLKFHRFQVSSVLHVGVALRMLTEKKENFDLILIDSDMRDVDTFTFLRLTRNMDILSMVMCQDSDDDFLLQVIENGGFRVVTTPLTNDVVMHIRQDVIRAHYHKFEKVNTPRGEIETGRAESGSRQGGKKRAKKRHAAVTRKVCVEWTEELHARFLKAYNELPPDRRYPRKILDAMGVPGLTRLQVASHLQKYKKDLLKMQQRKEAPSSSRRQRLSSNVSNEADLRTVGNIPNVATHVENHDQILTNVDGISPSNATTYVNNQSLTDFSVMNSNVATHVENRDQAVTNVDGISPSNATTYVNNQSLTDFSVMNSNVATHVENRDQTVTNVNVISPSNAGTSVRNGSGVENLEDVYTAPTDFDHNSFEPNQVSDDFFDFSMIENLPLACMELNNESGPNSNSIPEQIPPQFDQEIPPQGTSEFNQQM